MTNNTNDYLYRGMNDNMYKKLQGRLTPNGTMTIAELYPSEHLFPSKNLYSGKNQSNAIDKHQNQERHKEYDEFKKHSAYLSTTPHYERAKYYATNKYKENGYVFIINRNLLSKHNVQEFSVKDIASIITVPEDDEILILTNPLGSSLIENVIISIEPVEP